MIDVDELIEALKLYYQNGLDYVPVENVNNELRELIPGKPLISQLDQDGMASALALVPRNEAILLREAIAGSAEIRAGSCFEVLLRLCGILHQRL